MLEISISVTSSKEVMEKIKKLEVDIQNWGEEFQKIGEACVDFYSRIVFDTEGSIFGSFWKPLTRPYEWYKLKKWGRKGILEASGKLRGSFTFKSSNDYLLFYNPVKYGIFHQKGTSRGLPKRVIIKMSNQLETKIMDIFKQALERRLENATVGS